MTPLYSVMLAVSVDNFGDLIFIAIFVVVSLGNFLYKLFKQKLEEKKTQYEATAEEMEERRRKLEEFRKKSREIDDEARRREIWAKQAGQSPAPANAPEPSPPPFPSPQAPKPVPTTFKELIDAWKSDFSPTPEPEIRNAPNSHPLPTPAPLPELAKRETRRTSTPLRPGLPLSVQEELAERKAGAAYLMKEEKASRANSFGRLLRDPHRYREAVLLKEILDKPVVYKWLNSAQDSD